MKMNQTEIDAFYERKKEFLQRMGKTAKPSKQDQKDFCDLRDQAQKIIAYRIENYVL